MIRLGMGVGGGFDARDDLSGCADRIESGWRCLGWLLELSDDRGGTHKRDAEGGGGNQNVMG